MLTLRMCAVTVGGLLLAACSPPAEAPPRVDTAAPSAVPTPAPGASAGGGVTQDATDTGLPQGLSQGLSQGLPDALPTGPPPRLSYVDGRVLRRPDGSTVRLRLGMRGRWGVTSVAPLADGHLVTDDRFFEGTIGMHRLAARGHAVRSWASTGRAWVGPGGEVAWMEVPVPEAMRTGPPRLHVDDEARPLPGHHAPTILQFDGALVVHDSTLLRPRPARRVSFESTTGGWSRRVPRPQERFPSPDLQHWWRWTDRGIEVGRGEAVVRAVADRGLRRSASHPAWEDDRHLLLTLVRGGRQCLVRLGVGGRTARVTPWVAASVAGHALSPRRVPQ